MYKLVVQSICGKLEDGSACLIPIISHNLTPDTVALNNYQRTISSIANLAKSPIG